MCIKNDDHKIVNEKLIEDLDHQTMTTLNYDNLINKLNIDYCILINEKSMLKNNINILTNDNNILELE